ncbi:F-box protein PP2-A13-like [Humulus lupulus]|uniref:F-box protein PP2-A13-like n=1 Tax=Humulus lupulus TaxID=3486 RepID=UPI002B40DC0D|nr:F-box protein PP2-A13-like [Humulus lupulus]
MRAGFSVLAESAESSASAGIGIGIGINFRCSKQANTMLDDLPENCISTIIKYLNPPEICKLALLNRAFHGASLADFVWESKLPSNYKFLVEKLLLLQYQSQNYIPKKLIYSKLCQPNRFDGGTKEAWLEKTTGKLCLSISSKALRITGIDDRRYWNYIPTEESRFHTVAYLQQIWWFEVIGELELELAPGSYSLYFRLQLGKASRRFGRRVCNLDQVHGWDLKPARFHLSTSNGHKASSECHLNNHGNWVHYRVGDFVVENPNMLVRINFSMVQIDCTHTKGGLCLDTVYIYPTEISNKLLKS